MPTFTTHAPGTFSWIELATTDAEAAKRFYGGLFGWTFEDMPAGPNMTYTMVRLNGQHAAALYKKGPEMASVPPCWASYVTVEDVEAATKKVAVNGGKIVKDPFDVLDVGRMSVVEDPTGATFCLWQAKKHIGAGVKDEPGAMCWNELFTSNVDAAGKFYASALGWQPQAIDMGQLGVYTLFKRPGEPNAVGGMSAKPADMSNVPSHWLAYVAVADCDASAKKASELGGKLVVPPTDIPNTGRFAIVQDPQGATFGLYQNLH